MTSELPVGSGREEHRRGTLRGTVDLHGAGFCWEFEDELYINKSTYWRNDGNNGLPGELQYLSWR